MKLTHVAALFALALASAGTLAATNWSLGSSASSTGVDCNYRSGSSGEIEINKSTNTSAATLAHGNTCRIQGRDAVTGNLTAAPNDNAMVSAWSTTNQAGGTTYWEDAKLKGWLNSGFGVTNRDASSGDANEGNSPEHAVDNDQRTDGVLYTFTQNIALQTLRLGWSSNDTDLAVFRFVGAGLPPQLSTTTAGGLISAGWEHVGNYADVGTSASLCLAGRNSNGTCKTNQAASSWWLITAYNPTYGGNLKNTGTLNACNDYFKLLTVSGDNKVSEPAALALAGFGLFFAVRWRRRPASVNA
ncbi:MAG: PEP-CTERM sorting domain-containing protein [Inhella sp.]|jgi:MYXO-CTERM domain-containing protein|uniref:exosortase-dependent surface protein XDP1 n=1 Tax=Inhella sp. TaxID=1921806 RepID=UPI0022C5D005|nr:exosortase-dependent surface protein XDP1 [Inhella sp.]MCZ8233532.1 PEP-CTERM sorting domain-containing protein [Inhella sp.]